MSGNVTTCDHSAPYIMRVHFCRQLATVMSYLYESTADDYSAPTSINSFPLWETVEREQDLTLSSQQQQLSEEEHLSSSIFQLVNLGDEPLEHNTNKMHDTHSTVRQVKVTRSARSKYQSMTPYQRPRSAVPELSSSGSGTSITNAQVPLRFVHHNLISPTTPSSTSVSVTPSARHSPVTSTPGPVDGYETLSATCNLIFCSYVTQIEIPKCWQYFACTIIGITTSPINACPPTAKFCYQPLTTGITNQRA